MRAAPHRLPVMAIRIAFLGLALWLVVVMLALAAAPVMATDGQIAFISSREGDYKLYLMDVTRLLTRKLSDQTVLNCCLSWSPDGEQLGFMMQVGLNNELFLLRLQDNTVRRMTRNSGTVQNNLVWSPDGQQLLVVSADGLDRGIFRLDVATSERQPFDRDTAYGLSPRWSPDGQHIAFVMGEDGQQATVAVSRGNSTDIFVADIQGNEPRLLTQPGATNLQPVWSPDGTQLAFVSVQQSQVQIQVVNQDGSQQRPLTRSAGQKWSPLWSPDGQQIAFMASNNGQAEIYIVTPASKLERQLTHNDYWEWDIQWSPDGQHVVYEANPNGNFGLYEVDVKDGSTRLLTPDAAYLNTTPIWRP